MTTTSRLVDAAPARAHLQSLLDQGAIVHRISLTAGVPRRTLTKLLNGHYDPHRPPRPVSLIKASSVERILAVRPGPDVLPKHGHRIADAPARRDDYRWLRQVNRLTIAQAGERLGVCPRTATRYEKWLKSGEVLAA